MNCENGQHLISYDKKTQRLTFLTNLCTSMYHLADQWTKTYSAECS